MSRRAIVRPIVWALTVTGLLAAMAGAASGAPAARAGGSPQVVIILLDTNITPGRATLPAERAAAAAYSRALPAGVQAGLIVFSDSWQTVLAPTASRAQLAAALAAAKPAGGTSRGISAALAGAVAAISRVGASAQGRLLVLSNGEYLNHPVRPVSVPTDVVSWYYDKDDYPAAVRHLAAASGGHVADPAHVASLVGYFSQQGPSPSPSARPAASHSAQAAVAAPAGQRLSTQLIEVLAGVFLVLFIIALLVLRSLRPGERRLPLADQIERYGPKSVAPATPRAGEGDGKVAQTAVGLMSRVLKSGSSEPKLAQRLDHAGITRPPAEWALLGVCISVALAAMLTVLLGNVASGILIGIPLGWLGMRVALSVKISRRRRAFDDQLPNVLQLVAGSLQTGFSLAQALDAVVREDAQPASGDFARALGEARLGVDLADALEAVAGRLDSADLRWTVMAVRIQRETGGNLAEVLRNTVATMRERAYLRRQIRSLSAEGRLSAYILLALPILLGGWLFYSDAAYERLLYTTFLGLSMLIGATVLVVIGAFWMRNLIDVEV